MKAAIYEGIGKITVKTVNEPVCGSSNIVIKVKACAICGTDVRIYRHGKSNLKPPQITGHEISGVVEETGKDISVFKKGDRVAVAAIVACGKCYFCRKGRSNLCENFSALGYEHPGGFAEYMAVPEQMLADGSVNRISDKISFDEACLAEPFACVINAQELVHVNEDDNILIIGAGPVGCMHIGVARSFGAKQIMISEISQERLKIAEKFSADVYINAGKEDVRDVVMRRTSGRGADVIIIAAPSPEAQEQSLEMIAPFGRINFFGGLPKDNHYIKLDSNIVHYKEVFISGTSGSLPVHNQKALELFTSGKIDAKKYITHKLPLEKIVEGLEIVEKGQGLKVVINP